MIAAYACTVRYTPGAPPGSAGVLVLPSAPKASATTTLILRSPWLTQVRFELGLGLG